MKLYSELTADEKFMVDKAIPTLSLVAKMKAKGTPLAELQATAAL